MVLTNSSQMNLIKGLIFYWTVFETIMNISSPNSLQNWCCIHADFGKGIFTRVPTWENFELTQQSSLNYFVYLIALHQVKNYYTFKGWYTRTNIEKKLV